MTDFTIPTGAGVPLHTPDEVLVEVAYLTKQDKYFLRVRDSWEQRNERSIIRALKLAGVRSKQEKGEFASPMDRALDHIQNNNQIDIAIPLSGYPSGRFVWDDRTVLVTRGCNPVTAVEGDWSTLRTWLCDLFGPEVLPHHLGWWQWARKSVFGDTYLPGQVPIYIGPSGSGKSFLQGMTTKLLGGRSASPFAYMSGKTQHNRELFEADHLVIEDQFFDGSGKVRREFGTKLKELAVNQVQRCRGMYLDGMNLRPKWRVSMSLNDEEENRNVLPPFEPSVTEKLMLIRTNEAKFPVDLSTTEGWAQWDAIVERELPALAYAIDHFEIPESLRSARYGVKPWHDRGLMQEEKEHTPESVFLSCLAYDLPSVVDEQFWEGKAIDLERLLTGSEMPSASQFRKLLSWQHACGAYLGRLATSNPEIVTRRRVAGSTIWRIDVTMLGGDDPY